MVSELPSTSGSVRVRVPAKINLALKVGPRRRDGYHPLATVYHAVSLFDELLVTQAEPGHFSIDITGEGAASVPRDDSNLALRAAKLLASSFTDDSIAGARIEIAKAIPVAGGLAGGSADGAAALVACSTLWELDLSPEQLRGVAALLGSDVPFALLGGTALGSGRGEEVMPALARGTFHWVLGFGHQGLSTPAVYRRFDELNPRPATPVVPVELMEALRAGDAVALGAALVNDLQPAALDLQPGLRQTISSGLDLGAVGALVSGSGPTVAFLAGDEAGAIELAVKLSSDGVCRSVRRASGPVPGARIL
ncbi:MAG TPA: 4-(cytidine 5'-diphospho)-2-C-methyl-D-erythritol kinase [Microlunatus sp.]|nr:4-(cytidine 5'-diphospho)-2-C-methyl-D-erythritol kinase [Microlunatus sp.]